MPMLFSPWQSLNNGRNEPAKVLFSNLSCVSSAVFLRLLQLFAFDAKLSRIVQSPQSDFGGSVPRHLRGSVAVLNVE